MPDQTRNLANRRRHLHLRHVYLGVEPPFDFTLFRRLEEQRQRFRQVLAGPGNGLAFAGDVQLRTQGDIAVALSFDDRRKLQCLRLAAQAGAAYHDVQRTGAGVPHTENGKSGKSGDSSHGDGQQ